jgi:hypothetical protein
LKVFHIADEETEVELLFSVGDVRAALVVPLGWLRNGLRDKIERRKDEAECRAGAQIYAVTRKRKPAKP